MTHATLTFDTLQYAKKLKKAGFTEQQAEVQAEVMREQNDAINKWVDNSLATKRDIELIRHDLEVMSYKITYKLTIRLGCMITGAVVILGVLMPLMLKFVNH
ncbi:MAG: hypothetical protein A2X78_03280 [Gammaproteobacteria bacterium GWE2_37_16]|nr:MAG: hypothetical protein A2X78_03280 [Gammaproteobacteria bacterium GWE2_37_16]